MRDEVFREPIKKQFEFDESVASVFDDMISRSVPYYGAAQQLVCEVLARTLNKGARVVDLGCSTASLLMVLAGLRDDFVLLGVDSSEAMIEQAGRKAGAFGAKIFLARADVLDYDFKGADAVILNYTLQFIRPIKRADFVARIYSNLNAGGVFVFSEKLVFEDKTLTKNMIEIYENYKEAQGYSRYEIAQKRKALENVLIPYSEAENRQMCADAGFARVECLFRWGNFATFIAFK